MNANNYNEFTKHVVVAQENFRVLCLDFFMPVLKKTQFNQRTISCMTKCLLKLLLQKHKSVPNLENKNTENPIIRMLDRQMPPEATLKKV